MLNPRAVNFRRLSPTKSFWLTPPFRRWAQRGTRLAAHSPRIGKLRYHLRMFRSRNCPRLRRPRQAKGMIYPSREGIPLDCRGRRSLQRAGRDRARGWPAYAIPGSMGDPTLVARDPFFVSGNYRNLGATLGWFTVEPMEPLAGGIAGSGAERVDAGEFRALDTQSGMICPLVERDF